MKTHRNYFEIEAESYFDLGRSKGELFDDFLRASLADRKADRRWKSDLSRAGAYVVPAAKAFPHLIEEAHGYAEGARVCFEEVWLLMLEDELAESAPEKCTTLITNHGAMIGHNEDWEPGAQEAVCVMNKKIGELRIFELFYMNTLGGNSISINSNGYVHAINSLSHTDSQVGVPRNLVARWMSETASPERDYERLAGLKRASGYHHNLVNLDGRIWSMECSAARQNLTRPQAPFVHTNHFLTNLSTFEDDDEEVPGTRTRYRCAMAKIQETMSVSAVQKLLGDTTEGRTKSIFNERTIASMVIDIPAMRVHVWLGRERDKGWVSYPISDVLQDALSPRAAHQLTK